MTQVVSTLLFFEMKLFNGYRYLIVSHFVAAQLYGVDISDLVRRLDASISTVEINLAATI